MASATRRCLRAIADSEGEPERRDTEVPEGLRPHPDDELESAEADAAGPQPQLGRQSQEIEAEVLEVRSEDVPDRHREQSVQIREDRPVPSELGDERAPVAEATLDVSREGLVATEHDQLGERDRLAPQRVDEGGHDPEADHAPIAGDVPVSLDARGVADAGEPAPPP